jgi:hypothetical protein
MRKNKCVASVPRICSDDSQCPAGAHCDLAQGGICTFDCLPADTCGTSSAPEIASLCCDSHSPGTFCDCRGRCVSPDHEQQIEPVLFLAGFSTSPSHLAFKRPIVTGAVPSGSVMVTLDVPEFPEDVEIEVTAGRGLVVSCSGDATGDEPATSTFAQTCGLAFQANEAPTADVTNRRLWVRLNEPPDTPEGAANYRIVLRLHQFVAPYLESAEVSVSVKEPQGVLEKGLAGVCRGKMWVAGMSSGSGLRSTLVNQPAAVTPGVVAVTANVTEIQGVWTNPEYSGWAVRLNFHDTFGQLFKEKVFSRTYLAPADDIPKLALERDLEVAGDGLRTISLDPLTTATVSSELGELGFDRSTGKLQGSFVVDVAVREADGGQLGIAFDLACLNEEPEVVPAPAILTTPVVIDWTAALIALTLDPSVFPSFAVWQAAAAEGTVVSCAAGLDGSASALEAACRSTVGKDLATEDTNAEEACSALAAEVDATYFAGTPPYPFEVFAATHAACTRSPGRAQCPSACNTDWDVTVTIDGVTTDLGFCRTERTSAFPDEGESLQEWQGRRARTCAFRFTNYDPEAGQDTGGFAESATDELDRFALPSSGDIAYLNSDQKRVIARSFGFHHLSDRRALGQPDPFSKHVHLVEACRKDLTRPPPSQVQSSDLASLTTRLANVFDTDGCLGLASYHAGQVWLERGAAAGDDKSSAALLRRLGAYAAAGLVVVQHDRSLGKAGAMLHDDDDPESLVGPRHDRDEELESRVAREVATRIARLRLIPEAVRRQTTAEAFERFDAPKTPSIGLEVRDILDRLADELDLSASKPSKFSGNSTTLNSHSSHIAGDLANPDLDGDYVGNLGGYHNDGSAPQIPKSACDIFDDGTGLCETASVPIYFVDPTTTNSKFFATSDYVLQNWARPAVDQARQALDTLRAKYVVQQDRLVSDRIEVQNHESEQESIEETYGGRIAELCGLSFERLVELGLIDFAKMAEEGFDKDEVNSLILEVADSIAMGTTQCQVSRVPVGNTTCPDILLDIKKRWDSQACGGITREDLRSVKVNVCTIAAMHAYGSLHRNAAEHWLHRNCGTLGQAFVGTLEGCGQPVAEGESTPGRYLPVLWHPWLKPIDTNDPVGSVLHEVATEMVSKFDHYNRNHPDGYDSKHYTEGFSPDPDFTSMIRDCGSNVYNKNIEELHCSTSEYRQPIDQPDYQYNNERAGLTAYGDHYTQSARQAYPDYSFSPLDGDFGPGDGPNKSPQENHHRFGIPMAQRLFTVDSISVDCSAGEPGIKYVSPTSAKSLSVPISSGWYDQLELEGFPSCSWPDSNESTIWQVSEFLPSSLLGSGGNHTNFRTRAHEALGLPTLAGRAPLAEVPLWYHAGDQQLEPYAEYFAFGGRHVAYQEDISELQAIAQGYQEDGCQAYLHARTLASIRETCQQYVVDADGGVSDGNANPPVADISTLSSCFRGEIGEHQLAALAAESRLAVARASLAGALESMYGQTEYCLSVEGLNDEVSDSLAKLGPIRVAFATIKGIVDTLSASMHVSDWTSPGQVAVGVPLLAASAALMGVGIALADMEQQHEELVQDVATEKEESACWLEVERMKYEVAVVMESVQAAALDAAAALVRFRSGSEELRRVSADGMQRLRKSKLRFEETKGDEVDPAPGTVRYVSSFATTSIDLDTKNAARELAFAAQMVKILIQSLSHETQSNWSPSSKYTNLMVEIDKLSALSGIDQVAATLDLPIADLEGLLLEAETSLATRSINGSRPDDKSIVLSIRDDLLALSDRSCGENDCPVECDASIYANPKERFRQILSDPKNALYDDRGNYLGQAVRFALTPQAELLHRCAERVWSVAASVEGDLIYNSAPRMPLFLLKQNTFQSQWCGPPESHSSDMQVGQWQPTVNHFKDIDNASMPPGESYAWAHLDGWLNVKRSDLYRDQYAEGGSNELAGRGLYGEYMLLLPWNGLLSDSSRILGEIDDILIRVDYVSVSNGSNIVVSPQVSGEFGPTPILLGPGQRCTDDDECATGLCAEVSAGVSVCCDEGCTGPCEQCNQNGSCVGRAPGTTSSACTPYAACGGGGECATTCSSDDDCTDETAYCRTIPPSGGNPGSSECRPLEDQGAECTSSHQCASGHCVIDSGETVGLCCESLCDGPCEECSSATGVCEPLAEDSEDPLCVDGSLCSANGSCNGSCGGTVGCQSGHYCGGATCHPLKDLGDECSAGQCESSYCVDGVCCESACATPCHACDITPGECLEEAASTTDADCATCTGSTVSPPVCAAGGICASASACPNGFVCASESPTCRTTCTAQGHCQTGYFCCVSGYGCDSGDQEECLATKGTGVSCVMNGECTSGTCETGACL